jgi:hypothetical protein
MKTLSLLVFAVILVAGAVGCSTGASVHTPVVDVGAGGAVGR